MQNWKKVDYDLAIKQFCLDNPSSTIFLAGEISHPGTSDLDFLIVDDKPMISRHVRPFLMGGNVITVPSFAVENIRSIENLNLRLLQGQHIEIQSPSHLFQLVEIIEWLPERILRCSYALSGNTTASEILLLYKSLDRSISAVEKLVGRSYSRESVERFGEINREKKLRNILQNSLKCAELAWDDFTKFMYDSAAISGSCTGKVEICNYYSFNDQFQLLMLYFSYVYSVDSQMSAELQSRTSISVKDISIDNELGEFVLNRWRFLSSIFDWFKEKDLTRGMIKYGWLLQ